VQRGRGFYHVSRTWKSEALGIEVRLPSVESFTDGIYGGGRRGSKARAACRIKQVKGLRWKHHSDSAAREEGGAFLSLEDFLRASRSNAMKSNR